ncbi:MAG: phospholipase [Candidatus Competibacteraceae bacterium]|nr:phospholipase [Candidatus Competibacteraceae bacterium]
MGGIWQRLTEADLRQLSGALRAGRLTPPFNAVGVRRYLATEAAAAVAAELQRQHQDGLKPDHLAGLLDALAEDRAARSLWGETLDLVTSGPEAPGVALRDTAVVVRELFSTAQHSVLAVGYAVHQGRQVFRALAERMEQRPALQVRLCLDVQRPWQDNTPAERLLQQFAERFQTREWPGERLPTVYYDQRSLELDAAKRASLHAKCVVVDRQTAFVSSANFTEAAQVRNIEVGVLIRNPVIAESLNRHFAALIEAGVLRGLGQERHPDSA